MRSLLGSIAVIVLACALAGCQASQNATPAQVIHGTVSAADGVSIAYDVRGKGDTSLVFIHGWCSNREFWRDQLDAMADDYRVVAIDLPGHGSAGRDREDWSFSTYAGDVRTVVESLDLDRVILIGHSMGGPVSLEAAALLPQRVIGIVAVDTLHDVERIAPPALLEQIATGCESDFEGLLNAFLPQFFPPEVDPELPQWVIGSSLKADQTMAAAIMRDQANLDQKALLSAAGVPVRAINAAAGDPRPAATEIEKNKKYGDFDAVFIEGVGHFPHMEKPAEFNAKLRGILDELTRQ